ncbi:hypothetical protein KFL_002760170 [Klebsormidium nitens]|uniref:B9 domain-containing protein 2 n=1 Tax=Klebsormidium nitens TaxID=105231 RepID=A0A1Y1IAR8_KLENI|nr:hypothetical protein KFL_002760170 [Klebsormidium nitens]|eukprot:GAQ86221.1 hypothetical protein KFL_002760170 [Klebsormidium nitens]
MEKSGQAHKAHGASLFIFGSVLGGTGFKPGTLCKWKLVAGRDWVLVAGAISGSTQCGMPGGVEGDDLALWEHPLNVHFKTQTSQGWPKFCFTVFHRSPYLGRDEFQAYGICALPTTAGDHELTCPTWRPNDRGNRRGDEIAGFFTGNLPELADESFIHDRDEAFSASIQTVGMGTVHLRLSLLFKDFDHYAPLSGLTRGAFSSGLRASRNFTRRRVRETGPDAGLTQEGAGASGDEATGQEERNSAFRSQRKGEVSEGEERRRAQLADRMIRTVTRNRVRDTDSEREGEGSTFESRRLSRSGSHNRAGLESGSSTDRVTDRVTNRFADRFETDRVSERVTEKTTERRQSRRSSDVTSDRLLSPERAADSSSSRRRSSSGGPESRVPDPLAYGESRSRGPEKRGSDPPSEARGVFARLGRCLAEEGASARALFEGADADASGALSRTELRRLVQRILPGVSARELQYVQLMLDEGGTGRVTWPEFEALVQACASSEQASRQQIRVGSAEADVMRTLRFIASDDPARVRALFDQYDRDKSGYLDQAELLSMIRDLMPPMDVRDRRFIIANLAFRMDADGDGRIRLDELLGKLKE